MTTDAGANVLTVTKPYRCVGTDDGADQSWVVHITKNGILTGVACFANTSEAATRGAMHKIKTGKGELSDDASYEPPEEGLV